MRIHTYDIDITGDGVIFSYKCRVALPGSKLNVVTGEESPDLEVVVDHLFKDVFLHTVSVGPTPD